ncbi:MFS transporter [Tistrella mobilis]|uniref:MFS transporter n=1 Tax=Tistrella mobilis TaxID=171437 RepID=UPI0035579814
MSCPPPLRGTAGAWTVAALIAVVTAYSVALSATYTSLALSLAEAGHSAVAVAINAAMTPLGLVLSSLLLPRLIRGRPALWLSGGLVVSALLLVALAATGSDYPVVSVLRFLLGCSTNLLFVVGETALMMLVAPARRGKVLAAYNAIVTLGYASGPALLILLVTPDRALLTAALLVLLALLSLLPAAAGLPPDLHADERPGGLLRHLLLIPALATAAGATALFDNAALSLLPIAQMADGLDRDMALSLVTAAMIGAVVLQLPIGILIDLVDRRWVLIGLASASALGCVGLFHLPLDPLGRAIWLFLLGGTVFGAYSVTLALVADRFSGAGLVEANAVLAMCWGLGSLLGVPVVGAVMDVAGPTGFGWTTAAPFILCTILAMGFLTSGRGRGRTSCL